MSRCVDSLRAAQAPYRLQADEVQAFRLGATDEKTLIEPYLRAGYPSIGLEGEYGRRPRRSGRRTCFPPSPLSSGIS